MCEANASFIHLYILKEQSLDYTDAGLSRTNALLQKPILRIRENPDKNAYHKYSKNLHAKRSTLIFPRWSRMHVEWEGNDLFGERTRNVRETKLLETHGASTCDPF